MSNQQFTVTDRGSYFANFRHANGNEYHGELTGCGEAFEVRDEDGEIVTTIPTNDIGSLTDADIRLAVNAISTIDANKARIELGKQEEPAPTDEELHGFGLPHFDPVALAILRHLLQSMIGGLHQQAAGPQVHIGELHIQLHIHLHFGE